MLQTRSMVGSNTFYGPKQLKSFKPMAHLAVGTAWLSCLDTLRGFCQLNALVLVWSKCASNLSCLVPFWSFELPKWLRSGKLASLRCWQHSVDTTASADTLPVESGLFRRDVDSTSKRALHLVSSKLSLSSQQRCLGQDETRSTGLFNTIPCRIILLVRQHCLDG